MTITAVEPIVFDKASACFRVSLDQPTAAGSVRSHSLPGKAVADLVSGNRAVGCHRKKRDCNGDTQSEHVSLSEDRGWCCRFAGVPRNGSDGWYRRILAVGL